ncbi:hypothetical protein JOD43_001546 [Pullulanibacillus pueri]|uniref:DinB family protein n=1 Tax=Pullulanibacillus pueri TaxID=1437324 RepID=A0A8J2ZU79_9BACL|nr:hypothetical protein [Pullulanibacillus pueri]MBM7681379.1 hypothetical protein [Pullulanibacillus pueri]GGH78646.1 hypothetical protein GCM10007096_12390 [Pullulanibacillus pueri]
MSETLKNSVKTMIKETFEGPPVPLKGSWFVNSEPNSGIFGAIERMSCDEASTSIHGTTLAAHTDHVRYHLWGTNEILKEGKQPQMNWGMSWEIHSVDEKQWNTIQEGLRKEYLTLLEAIDAIKWNELLANEVLSSLAHSAYHLGAIRQMLKVVKV